MKVVHCGVDASRFAPPPSVVPVGRRTVICVARLEPKKGHGDLVRAFAFVAASRHDLDLVLIGDGPERETIEAQARTLGIEDRITLLGALPPSDVRESLATASLFVLAARRDASGRMDGIPVALIEAMASGVPVVSTSVSGIPELLGDGAGAMVAPDDPVALAGAMERLLDDAALACDLAERGRARVQRDFDLYTESSKLGDLFARSVSAGSSRRT